MFCYIIMLLLLAQFLCNSKRISAEAPPEFHNEGFKLGGMNFIPVDVRQQPIPKIIDGFADYENEPIVVDMARFYMADMPLKRDDLPDFFADHLIVGKTPNFSNFEVELLINYLNVKMLPIQNGKEVKGRYRIPTAADMIAYVSPGERYFPGQQLPAGSQSDFYHLIADRYSPTLNLDKPEQFNAIVAPCGTGDRGFLHYVTQKNIGLRDIQNKKMFFQQYQNNRDKLFGKLLSVDEKVMVRLRRYQIRLKFLLTSDVADYINRNKKEENNEK